MGLSEANVPKVNTTHIRRISPEDTWPLRHEVMWADKPFSYVHLADDEQGVHYGLFVEDQLISVVSLFMSGEEARFRKFATIQAYQRKGYGSQLLSHLLEEAAQMGAKRIWCSARVEAAPFYKKLGMQEAGQPFSKEGMPYVHMEKLLGHP